MLMCIAPKGATHMSTPKGAKGTGKVLIIIIIYYLIIIVFMSELDDLFPNCFLRERVIAHDQRSYRVFSLL